MSAFRIANASVHKSALGEPEDVFACFEVRRTDDTPAEVILHNVRPVPDEAEDILDRFARWVAQSPESVLVSEMSAPDKTLTYREADAQARALCGALYRKGLSSGSVIATIADASCDQAIIKLACLLGGMVHVSIAPANLGTDLGREKIALIYEICKPDIILHESDAPDDVPDAKGLIPVVSIGVLMADSPGDPAYAIPQNKHAPTDLAEIYFTSGSTGTSKGVMITRGMISAVQSRVAAHWPFLRTIRPVLVDWLPWHHVFGGLDNFFKIIWNGGTYHIRPKPRHQDMADVAAWIAQIRPTVHTDVPFGLSLLLDQLENNPHLAEGFLDRLELVFFAGAGMDANTWRRLNRLIHPSRSRTRLASGYGATEAGSTISLGHERPASPGEIGIPLPGTELRLVEVDGRTEVRVRGPHISPGYLGPDGQKPLPLDEKGYFMTGDTAVPLRTEQAEKGMVFDGRLAEDFKLTNGTRVKVGALRQLLLSACAPYLQDVAIAGESEPGIGVLLFPSHLAQSLESDERVRFFSQALAQHNTRWPGSSMTVKRAIVAAGAANPAKGEINDKGHLVQRRTLKNRAADVKRLFALKPDAEVIVPKGEI